MKMHKPWCHLLRNCIVNSNFFFKLSLIRIIRHHVFIELKILIAFTILDVGILKQGRVD